MPPITESGQRYNSTNTLMKNELSSIRYPPLSWIVG
jgi:hypothetical protein